MYQSIELIGWLGREPEMRYTPKGVALTKFSVATSNYKDETAWFNITVFGDQAESANQYLDKGSPVYIRGTLNFDPETGAPRVWEGKNGVHRASFDVTASLIKFLPSGGEKKETKQIADEVPW